MSGNTYLDLVVGLETVQNGLQISSGAGDAGKIVSLDGSGKLDISLISPLNGTLDLGSHFVINGVDPVNPQDLATKNYVDLFAQGIIPQECAVDSEIINDSLSTPPVFPVIDNTYIIGVSPTGAWATIGAGHYTYWDGDNWYNAGPVTIGDRLGINFEHAGTLGGNFVGKQNKIAVVANATPGSYAYTFIDPVFRWTVSICNPLSFSSGDTYYYDGSNWLEINTGFVPDPGAGIGIAGSTINALVDNTTIGVNGNNQLFLIPQSTNNFILNPSAEVNTNLWDLYNNSGNTTPAVGVNQDLTFTSAVAGDAGNGVLIEYAYNVAYPYTAPNVTVISATHVKVSWKASDPTLLYNPTATQLKAAWDAVPAALAVATVAITGVSSKLQYGLSVVLSGGGDTSPTTGTGGTPVGVAFTRTTISPIIEVASFLLSKDAANREGQGVAIDFNIDSIDQGLPLQISFLYSGSSGMVLGANSDVQIFVYDITNAKLVPLKQVNPYALTPPNTLKGPVNTVNTFTGQFTAANNSTAYRLIFHIATQNAAAWDLKFDSVVVNNITNPEVTTEVPSLVLHNQPISGAVTDHMAVALVNGALQWVPATWNFNGDFWGCFGFATNIVGSVADIYIRGYMDGFGFGPLWGYNEYVDPATPGGLTTNPVPYTDTYLIMGKAISPTAMNIQPFCGVDLVGSKGGLLSNGGLNNGTGDEVLAVGTNGNVLVANSGSALGLAWAPAVVVASPFTYTTATRTLSLNSQTANTFLAAPNGGAGTPSFRAIVAADIPTLNQNTTGSAAKWTTARLIAGNSVDGSANVTFANKFIVQGTTDAGLTGAQFLGALATGLVKNTTSTGVLSIAVAADTTGVLITGFVSGAGTVAATDTILQAINKLNGNIALKAALASPVFTGDVNISTGNLLISTIGKGLSVKTGANAKIGTAVLVAGTVTVANTSVTANSRIFLTSNVDGGTPGWLRVSAKTVSTSFVITSSSATDTSTVAWVIIESIP